MFIAEEVNKMIGWDEFEPIPFVPKRPKLKTIDPSIRKDLKQPKYKLDNYIRRPVECKHVYTVKPKKFSTLIQNDLSKHEYYKEVWAITEAQALESLSGIELRGANYHLDHIMPIAYGFKHNIPPEYIGRLSNLRIITRKENFKKGARYNQPSNKWSYLNM